MLPVSREVLRILDANMDRAAEGLRVLEDMARLALNDAALSRQLKDLRHTVRSGPLAEKDRLRARDAAADVGRDIESPDQQGGRDLVATVVANARRVQEGLRVIEELARTPGTGLDPQTFKEARFSLYAVERDLVSRLLRQGKVRDLNGLYVTIDIAGPQTEDIVEKVLRGGARALELRPAAQAAGYNLQIVTAVKKVCRARGALLMVSERVDLALASGADGVSLGQESLPVEVVRPLLALETLIGFRTNNLKEALEARAAGADFLICSAAATDLPELRTAGLPLVIALAENSAVTAPIESGADAIAINASGLGGPDIERTVRDLVKRFEDRNR